MAERPARSKPCRWPPRVRGGRAGLLRLRSAHRAGVSRWVQAWWAGGPVRGTSRPACSGHVPSMWPPRTTSLLGPVLIRADVY